MVQPTEAMKKQIIYGGYPRRSKNIFNMKKLHTIFWENGVMMAEELELCHYASNKTFTVKDCDCSPGCPKYGKEAARQAALPVADESKEKVVEIIWQTLSPNERDIWEHNYLTTFPNQTKEYQIEAEMREEDQRITSGHQDTIFNYRKVLILVD